MSEEQSGARQNLATWSAYPPESSVRSHRMPALQKSLGKRASQTEPSTTHNGNCFRKRGLAGNRRDSERVTWRMDILIRRLSVPAARPKAGLKARVVNISRGGMCIATSKPLAEGSVVRCELLTADLPVAVPTLLQVRWVEKTEKGEHLCGLLYLV